MKTNKRHSTKNNKALTGLSKLKSRSEQVSGETESQTGKTTETAQTPETTPAPAPAISHPSTLNSQLSPAPAPVQAPAETQTLNSQQSTLNSPKRILPYVNYQLREANRSLATDEVLDSLRRWAPAAYELAEVVGKWVWITFPEQPAEHVRGQLSQFGFHWNNVRKCWQHPCGHFTAEGSAQDPRQRYGSHFAADLRAA